MIKREKIGSHKNPVFFFFFCNVWHLNLLLYMKCHLNNFYENDFIKKKKKSKRRNSTFAGIVKFVCS